MMLADGGDDGCRPMQDAAFSCLETLNMTAFWKRKKALIGFELATSWVSIRLGYSSDLTTATYQVHMPWLAR